jgi:hypothetical protein
LPFDKPYWLGITVENGAELAPRIALTASPYSLNSHSTIAEPQPGQGITIRNGQGEATHVLSADGDVVHEGKATIAGGILIPSAAGRDTALVAVSDNTTTAQTSSKNSESNQSPGRVEEDVAQQNNIGVYGTSNTGIGVKGLSDIGTGVEGESPGGIGVWGKSDRIAVLGQTDGGDAAVAGQAKGNAVGGQFVSEEGPALVAITTVGELAALLDGQVQITKVNEDPNEKRVLVWSQDKIVRYRTIPGFDGVLDNQALVVKDAQGNEVFRVDPDGTSFHGGLETFNGGVFVRGKAFLGEDFIFIGAKNLIETSQALKNAGKTTGPNVLFFAKDSTGEDTAGLFSSVSGERPSVYAEKRPPGSNFSAASAMNEHLQSLNQISAQTKENLSPDFSQFFSQQNLPSIWGVTSMAGNEAVLGQNSSTTSTSAAMRGVHVGRGVGVMGQIANASSTAPAIWGFTSGPGSGVAATVTGNGTGALVDHNGATGHLAVFRRNNANQIRFDLTGKGFFNGGTQTGGADVAEAFEVEGTVQQYEPGDVLVISINADRKLEKSAASYSTLVAGVYATKPGVLLTERNIDDPHDDTVPLGVVGVIPTKVCGENGPIRRGDLLVTSSLSGHAMKGTERERMLGAVLGKALENFDGDGRGVIKVLVNVK